MRERDFRNYSGRREEEGSTGSEGGGSERQWGMGREGRGYGETGWAGDEGRRRARESGWYGTGEGNGGRRYAGEGYGGGQQPGGYWGQQGGYGGQQGGYGGWQGGYGGGQYGGSQYYGAGQYSGQGYPYQGGYGGGYWQGGGYSSGQLGYGEREPRSWREGERGWREGERGWREGERGWRGEGERGRREEEGWPGQQRRWEGERGWERGEPRGWHEGERWADRFWGGGEPRGPGEATHGQAGGGWDPAWHRPERRSWFERPRETTHEESWGESVRNFFGIGPKGYQRSDQRISDEVCDRLTDDPRVNAGDMTINVREGEVVLEGLVDNRFMKRLAEDVVEGVSGVRNVENRLRIRRDEPQVRPEQRREMTKGENYPGEGSHLISKGTEPDDVLKHQEAVQGRTTQPTGATGEQNRR